MRFWLFVYVMFLLGGWVCAGSMTDDYITIHADELEIKGKQDIFSAIGDVRVQFKGARISGLKGEYYKRKQTVYVTDQVILLYKGVKVKANQLIGYGKKDMISISDDVIILYQDMQGTCEQAEYDVSANSVVLLGTPQIMQDGNRISGEKMEIYFETGKIKTIGHANVLFETRKTK